MKVLDAKRVKSICECAYNLLRGNVQPTPDQSKLRKLKKYKGTLRRLAKRGESWVKKRRYLVQKGGAGFLVPLLLSTVLQTVLQAATS